MTTTPKTLTELLENRPFLNTSPAAVRLAALLRLEDMILNGLTLAEACRQLTSEGTPVPYTTCQRYAASRGLAGKLHQNHSNMMRALRLAAGGMLKSPANDRGPLHPYKTRYRLLRTATAYCLIDRMSERFSTPREWREWIIEDFPLTDKRQAEKLVRRLNAEWKEKLKAQNSQTKPQTQTQTQT